MKNNFDILKKVMSEFSQGRSYYDDGFVLSKTINPITKTGLDYVIRYNQSNVVDTFRIAVFKEDVFYPRYLEDCVFYKNEQYIMHVYVNVPVCTDQNTQYIELVDIGFEITNQPVVFTNPILKFKPDKINYNGKTIMPGLLDVACEVGNISITGHLGKHISSRFITYLQQLVTFEKGLDLQAERSSILCGI